MNTNISTRVAAETDMPAINQCLSASYAKMMALYYDGSTLEDALPYITVANPDLIASGKYYVAYMPDVENSTVADVPVANIVGCGGWSHRRPATGEVVAGLGHIRHFATHPEWTGKNVGRMIFEQCRKAAIDAGLTQFECFSSLNAEKFYTALGFSNAGTKNIKIAEDVEFPSLVMKRPL